LTLPRDFPGLKSGILKQKGYGNKKASNILYNLRALTEGDTSEPSRKIIFEFSSKKSGARREIAAAGK